MDFLTNLHLGFSIAFSFGNLMYAFVGVVMGTAIGVLPGLGPPATIAMLLPLTYHLEPIAGIIMLAGIFYGAMYGGSTTSILLNIPGEAASIVTCLDGYQLARQGRAGVALGLSALGSFFAGTVGILGVSLLAPPLAAFALKFGPVEYSSLLFLGLMMAVFLSEGSAVKGLMMVTIGLLLGTVGLDPVSGAERFTFGVIRLTDGFDFVVVAMGLFGITEVLINMEAIETRDVFNTSLKKLFPSLKDWKHSWGAMVRGTLLGFFIGVLPGGGATISSFIAYAVEKSISKHPEQFGNGALAGVVSPESANNAAASSSFIPLLTLGIPGNSAIAMIFVALMIQGIQPGPLMLDEHPDIFWAVIASMYIGNVLLLVLNLPLIGVWVRLLTVPYRYLGVIIVVVCVIGTYSINNAVFDVGAMMIFGGIGYWLRKSGFPPGPWLLGMILGPRFEQAVQRALIGSKGNLTIFIKEPISAVLLLCVVMVAFTPLVRWLWAKRTLSPLEPKSASPK